METYLNRYATVSLAAIAVILVLVGAVFAPSDTETTTASVSVNQFLSVTLTNIPVAFPAADPLQTVNASGGNGFPLTATIGSESNVGSIFVKTKANNETFVSGANTMPVGSMKWDDANTGPWTNYTTSDATVCSGLGAGGTCNIYHQLAVPSAQAAGSYSVGITVTATT